MESVVAVRTNEGSPAAQSALAVLAATLNINENALKTALNGAFDLLPAAAGNTMLALQMSFQRLSYHIDSKALVEIIMTFRRAFGGALSMERVKYATPARATYSQVHGPYSDQNVHIGPPRYSAPGFRSSGEPVGQHYNFPVAAHYQTQNYPLPWGSGYNDNALRNASQPGVMSTNHISPVSPGYQGPIMASQRNEAPSVLLGDPYFGRYQ